MEAFDPKLIYGFKKIKEVDHHYWTHLFSEAALEETEICIANIQRIISKMTDTELEIYSVDTPSQTLRGVIFRYPKKAKIFININQSDEWIRFTTIKELCHVLLDQAGDFNINVLDTLRALLKNEDTVFDEAPSMVMKSENLAEAMAIEILYPLEWRKKDLGSLHMGTPASQIAQLRKIPLVKIEHALEPTHVDKCHALWEIVSKERTAEINWD